MKDELKDELWEAAGYGFVLLLLIGLGVGVVRVLMAAASEWETTLAFVGLFALLSAGVFCWRRWRGTHGEDEL